MKRYLFLLIGCLVLIGSRGQTVRITTDETISLIFPFSIRHVDRGTKDILVQPVKESDHILLVKAAVKDFASTNLSVVTTDGSIWSFPIQYDSAPAIWVYQIPAQDHASVETYANGILDNTRSTRGIRDRSWDVLAAVTGVYIRNDIIYYQLRLHNKSPIDYDIDFLRFYIRDKKKGKRTATQEIELKPLHVAGNTSQVKAGAFNTLVIALEKFTLPDAKYFAIEINERKGGRHLLLKVNNNKIIRAVQLPELK